MSIYMITAGEVFFVKEILQEMVTLADPSEYYEQEVSEALNILDKLMSYNTEQILEIADQMNQQIAQATRSDN